MLDGSILQKLAFAHRPGQVGKRLLNFGVYYKNTLVALCHALEDHILACTSEPLMVAAFQRGKWYLQEADRYADLAAKSRQVVIMAADDSGFAEHPTSQRDNVALVPLQSGDPVGQEWHLIILAPTYAAMVLCQELSVTDYGVGQQPREDWERKFYGLWTFEPALVHEALELAIAHIGTYNPTLQQTLLTQVADITALAPTATPDDLTHVVGQVVDYLQSSQQQLPAQSLSPSRFSAIAATNALDDNLVSNELQAFLRLAQLIDQTDPENPMAAAEVSALAEAMGQLLDLPAWQLHRLRLAGLLHRLSPLQRSQTDLQPSAGHRYASDSPTPLSNYPLPLSNQVLQTMPQIRAIATIITHQTECWDGSGQPTGLAGDEIPLESRILGLVADFQAHLTHCCPIQPGIALELPLDESLSRALAICQEQQGQRWDPKLVEALTILVAGLQQGLALPVLSPKIASGMWLLDSHAEENLLQG